MINKRNVLFIPRWYPNRFEPLKGIFIKRHALAVSRLYNVAVLFVNADPEMKDKLYDVEFGVEEGITTVRVYYNNSAPAIPVFFSLIKFLRYLRSCRKGIQIINKEFGIPDICHIHVLTRTFFPAFYYKFFHQVPFIVTEQWSGYLPEDGSYKGFFKKMLTRMAVRKASAVTTVSQSLKNAMLSHGLKNNYSIIPNVVDTDQFYPSREKTSKSKFYLLSVSDLDDRAKNISGTIRTIKKLSELRSDFEFHIIGDGDGRKEVEKMAAENGTLNKFVFFHGAKKSHEVAETMRRADLFLLFSNYDNMPCVMIESFASGVPVIGSAVNGIKENIKEVTGVLVPPGDEGALLQAINVSLDSINIYDKHLLHQYAKNNFSYEAVAKMFDTVYQRII